MNLESDFPTEGIRLNSEDEIIFDMAWVAVLKEMPKMEPQ